MATFACVYDAEPAVRRPHDVIAPPGGRHGNRPLRPGPVARGKWLSGSVADDPATVIGRAFDRAEYRDAGHRRPWVVLVDGAVHRLELVQQEAARRDAEISIVIDLVHVLELSPGRVERGMVLPRKRLALYVESSTACRRVQTPVGHLAARECR
ncbi:hypothetical protein ABT124_44420 [Streptomyces sp. NPDC001982]|uniref:hypothetical protein n=1 Tax=Streptomyces sp. NPDC001982 TaxID=3154405 RepID=UPI003318662A